MQDADYLRIPLRNRAGEVIAYALVDYDDIEQTTQRWCLSSTGYVIRNAPQAERHLVRHYRLHREIMGLGRGDSRMVDHINGDRLDNRRANLRIVSEAENRQNLSAKGYVGNRSGARGVFWTPATRRWRACVRVAGRRHHLGYFDTAEEASAAATAFREVNGMPSYDL